MNLYDLPISWFSPPASRRQRFLRDNVLFVYLAAIGVQRRDIAERLGVSVRTVEWRFGRLLSELNCADTTHLVGRAFELGLLQVVDGLITINPDYE